MKYLRTNSCCNRKPNHLLVNAILNQILPTKKSVTAGDFDSLITLNIYVASLELCYQHQYDPPSVYKDVARICRKGWDLAFCHGYGVFRVSVRSVYNKHLGLVLRQIYMAIHNFLCSQAKSTPAIIIILRINRLTNSRLNTEPEDWFIIVLYFIIAQGRVKHADSNS